MAWTETSSAEVGSSQTTRSGRHGEGSGDRHALALTAADLVRKEVEVALAQAHGLEQASGVGPSAPAVRQPEQLERAHDGLEDRPPGVEREVGVLEDDLEPAPKGAPPGPGSLRQGRAVQTDATPVGRRSPTTQRASVVLPEPLSPTTATVSPTPTVSETPSTARTARAPQPRMPPPAR